MTIICPVTRERALAPTKRVLVGPVSAFLCITGKLCCIAHLLSNKSPVCCKHEEMIIFRTGGQPLLFHVSFSFVSKIDDDDEEMI